MKVIRGILVAATLLVVILFVAFFLFMKLYTPTLSKYYGRVDAQLFTGDAENEPLIVVFGGSQGGNPWAQDDRRERRRKFLDEGYAVLAIGYFNLEGTPETLDRISLNAIYDTIKRISLHPKINKEKIMLLGASRGGELALNLASKYDDFDAVVALVPSNLRFPAVSITANTSAWTFDGRELPYMPLPLTAFLSSLAGDQERMWEIVLGQEKYLGEAEIEVEKINGPLLLMSAKDDEIWPSKYMCDKIVNRLGRASYKHYYEHLSFDGGHAVTINHFDEVLEFVKNHFH